MNFLISILKGFIIGLAKIIPGVSGAVLAISMGIYENAVEAISTFFKNPIKSICYLFPFGIGLLLAIIVGSNLIIYLLDNYYVLTLFLFIGLMLGGIPSLLKKISFSNLNFTHYMLLVLSFIFVCILSLINKQNIFMFNSLFTYSIIGFLDAFTMVVPGISGTALMMLLGCYNLLLELMSKLGNIEMFFYLKELFPYGLSLVVGIFLISKLMNYLFQKKELIIYSIIIGFMMSSTVLLLLDTFFKIENIKDIIIGIILSVFGFLISKKLD